MSSVSTATRRLTYAAKIFLGVLSSLLLRYVSKQVSILSVLPSFNLVLRQTFFFTKTISAYNVYCKQESYFFFMYLTFKHRAISNNIKKILVFIFYHNWFCSIEISRNRFSELNKLSYFIIKLTEVYFIYACNSQIIIKYK